MAMPASAGSGPTDTGKQIYNAALEYAKSRGYQFGDGSGPEMRDYANRAALDIEKKQLGEIGFNDAKHAFETLIDSMIEATQQIPGYAIERPNIIGERTLGHALNKLCPLWPFC